MSTFLIYIQFLFAGTDTILTKMALWMLQKLVPKWRAVSPWVEFKEDTYYRVTTHMETLAEEEERERLYQAENFDIRLLAAQKDVEAAKRFLKGAEEHLREERRRGGAVRVDGTLAGATALPSSLMVPQPTGGVDERDVTPMDTTETPAERAQRGTETGAVSKQSHSVSFAPSVTSTGRKVKMTLFFN